MRISKIIHEFVDNTYLDSNCNNLCSTTNQSDDTAYMHHKTKNNDVSIYRIHFEDPSLLIYKTKNKKGTNQ